MFIHECKNNVRRRRRWQAVVTIVTGLMLGACERSDWNWDWNWWKQPDRRVGPTTQPEDTRNGASTIADNDTPFEFVRKNQVVTKPNTIASDNVQ